MSELLKKYESLDQSKLNEGTIKILNRVKTITADFTADDAKNNKIAEDVLNEVMKKNPDAVKIVKRTPKAKTATKKTHKATHTTKGAHTTSSTAKSSNNIMSVAKEIQKSGESWKDAMERAKVVLKERKEQVVQKQKTELEKLYNLVKTKKELQGFTKSDIQRDAKRDAKPRGARVVTKAGFTSNQHGVNFPNKLGRKYWETRDRHADRLAPNYPKDMPLLASGGQIQNLVSILNGKYNRYGMSLKQIHEESIMYLGKENGELVFYEFIKENKGNEKLMKEFNKTAFADGGSIHEGDLEMMKSISDDGRYVVKGWATKKDFNKGESEDFNRFNDLDEAKHWAKQLIDENSMGWYASEVYDDEDGETIFHSEQFANGGGIDGGMNNLTIQNVSFAKGGKIQHTFKVGEIVSFPTQKNRYMDKPLLDMINHFSNKELVIEKINEDKPYNLADVYIKDTGEKLRDLILNPKVLKIYPDNVEDEKNVKIKDWYLENYPTDDLGEELNDDVTFEDMWNEDYEKYNIYQVMGVGDSVIRERIFEHLAEIKGVTYSDVYRKLFSSDGFYADGGGVGQKKYNTQFNVGKAKYVVNYHDGVKKHKDGSNFYDIAIFKNKKDFEAFLTKLSKEGYREMGYNSSFEKGGIFYKEGSNKYGLGNTEIFVQEENDMYCVYDNVYNDKSENWEIKKLAEFDTMDEAKEFAIEHSKKEYANGGSLPFMTDPNFGNFQNTGAFANGGSIGDLTEQEFLKKYFGASVFTENPSQYFEIKKLSSSDDAKVNSFVKELKADGFAVKKRAFSDFTSVMGVKKKASFELGGAFMNTDLAGHTGGSFGLGNQTPLSGVTGTNYTGLVGETGAMSSGELFMDGGAMAQNQQVINDASQSYVNYYLGEGASQGIYKDGGSIPNNYAGRTPEDVWNNWTISQKKHFLKDHLVLSGAIEDHRASLYRYDELPKDLLSKIEPKITEHIREGQYASGGSLKNAKELSEDGRFELKVLQGLSGRNNGLNLSGLYHSMFLSNYKFNKYVSESDAKKVEKALKSLIKKGFVDESGLGYKITQKGADYRREFDFGSYASGGSIQKVNLGSGEMELEDAIKMYEDKIKAQGRITNERDEDMLKELKRMRGNYASGGSLGKALYVANSSYFDYNKYDDEKIMSALKSIGAKNIHLEYDGGMSNQPEVVVFNGNKRQAEDALNEAFDTDYILIYEKDWRTKKMADGGFTPDVSDGTQFMSGVYANGGGIRSQEELNKIISEKDEKVKGLTPKQVAEMWNENSFGVKEGISKPITVEEAKSPIMKMYLRNLLIENELTEDEYNEYFESGGFVGTVEFNTGDVVWQKDEKRYATVMNNYGDPVNGDYGELRLDTTGNTPIFTYDKNYQSTGYNLVKLGEKGDTGKFTPEVVAEMKESANRLIDSRKERDDTEMIEYYEGIYKRLLDGEFDSMTGAKATASSKLKKYIDNEDIDYVALMIKGSRRIVKGSDVLNGANLLKDGGDLSNIAFYVPKRDVISVTLKNGKTINPVNGYWVKKDYQPISGSGGNNVDESFKIGDYVKKTEKQGSIVYGTQGFIYEINKDFSEIKLEDEYGNKNPKAFKLKGFRKLKSKSKNANVSSNAPTSIVKKDSNKLVAPKGYVFVNSGSHRATQQINRGDAKYVSLYSFGGANTSAGTTIMFMTEKDFEKVKDIRGVSPAKNYLTAKSQWFSRHEDKKLDDVFLGIEQKESFGYADGGEMESADITADLEKFNIDNLDYYEYEQYNHFLPRLGKAQSLQLLINTVDGDTSQLSPELAELAEKQGSSYADGGFMADVYADGGSTGSGFDPVKVKVVLAVGLDRAIEFYDADYPIRPYQLLERAVRAGYITLDEINERVVDSAMETAQDSEDMEEVGSSDFGAFMYNFLDEAGFKVGYVNGRLTREYADGGSFAPNVSDGTAFMDNAYFAKGGSLNVMEQRELRTFVNSLFNRAKNKISNDKGNSLFVVSATVNAMKGSLGNPTFYLGVKKIQKSRPTYVVGSGFLSSDMLVYESYKKDSRFLETESIVEAKKFLTEKVKRQILHLKDKGVLADGGMFDDNDGFMKADNNRSFRYPEREVHVDTIDEPIDLTNNVSSASNKVVIVPINENIDLNDDNRVRARMTQSNRGSAENFSKINPRAFEFIEDLPMPTSHLHKND